MRGKTYRSFTEARKFAQRLGLKDGNDYKRYYESGKVNELMEYLRVNSIKIPEFLTS